MKDTTLPICAPTLSLCQPTPAVENPAWLYLARLGDGARSTMRSALRTIARWFLPGADIDTFPWAALRYPHTVALCAHLSAKYSSQTVNRMMTAVRRVLREAWRVRLISLDELERASDVRRLPGTRLLRGRAVALDEIATMLRTAERDPKRRRGHREAALVWLLFGGGLRRAEVADLDLESVEIEGKVMFVRVIGKGNKERRVPLPPQGAQVLEAYLRNRGAEPGPLFRTQRRCRPHGVTIYHWLRALAVRAKIARTTPHECRRAYISELLDAGADLAVVQGLAGHADSATTARYDRRPERARAQAAALLRVPGVGDAA